MPSMDQYTTTTSIRSGKPIDQYVLSIVQEFYILFDVTNADKVLIPIEKWVETRKLFFWLKFASLLKKQKKCRIYYWSPDSYVIDV